MDVLSLRAAGFLAGAMFLLFIPSPRAAKMFLLAVINLAFLYLLHPAAPGVFLAVTIVAFLTANLAARGGSSWIFSLIAAAIASLLFLPKTGIFGTSGGDSTAGFAASFSKMPAFFAGSSYFILRALQFVFDARRERKVSLNFIEMIAWNGFFPTILAGPIERSQHFAESLDTLGKPNANDILDGIWRIYLGLLKKVVLSQIAFNFAQPLLQFETGTEPSQWQAWTSLYAFGLYFYFDFSGYSDLALGAGRFCGIRLAENFNNPYLKTNISEFWRAWHISLTSWIRDYIFIPLCGRGTPAIRLHAASWTSMVVCGLWHGLTPGWIIWGLFHGFALSIHQLWTNFLRKRFRLKQKLAKSKLARAASIFIMFQFLAVAWVWTAYATTGVGTSIEYFKLLIGL
ncbi:MAG: MBOAT family O-acyltransferase [Planctomycetota bacterium]